MKTKAIGTEQRQLKVIRLHQSPNEAVKLMKGPIPSARLRQMDNANRWMGPWHKCVLWGQVLVGRRQRDSCQVGEKRMALR